MKSLKQVTIKENALTLKQEKGILYIAKDWKWINLQALFLYIYIQRLKEELMKIK